MIRVTADPGETFLDRMIALVEGAKRQRTPNEIALAILLAGLTIVFLMATVTLRPFGAVRRHDRRHGRARRAARLPHPDDDRRPAVGDRHRRHGPRRPVQRPGDERPRGRGVRRRRRHPARQDRHDHLRQPARGLDHRRARRHRGGRRRGRPGRVDPATRRPRAARSSSSPASAWPSSGARPAPATTPGFAALGATIAEEIPFRAETRTSGVRTTDGDDDPEGRRRRDRRTKVGGAARRGHRARPTGSPTSAPRRSSSSSDGPRPRRHRAQGHRQGGARRALRRVPPDGHPDGDDHRRQPADRGDDRPGGRRRRLHRPGHARRTRSPSSASSRPTATSSR